MKALLLGSGALATGERSYTSLLIKAKKGLLLLDLGESPVRKILQSGYNPLELGALFLTHVHTDHIYALPILIHELMHRGKKSLEIFFPEPMQDTLKGMIELFFGKETSLPELNLSQIKLEEELQVFKEDGLGIWATPVRHNTPTLAYKVKEKGKSLVYAPDTRPCPQLIKFAQNTEILFHDATYFDDKEKAERSGHSTIVEALEDARQAQVRKLVLIHLGLEIGINKIKKFPKFAEVIWGRDGLTLDV